MITPDEAFDLIAKTGSHFRNCMPYGFRASVHPYLGEVWSPFNRKYFEYCKPEGAIKFKKDPRTFKSIWLREQSIVATDWELFLYNDDLDNAVSYFERLTKLLLHSHCVVGQAGEMIKKAQQSRKAKKETADQAASGFKGR